MTEITNIGRRQLYHSDNPDGYLEGDYDFIDDNIEICVAFLEGRYILTTAPWTKDFVEKLNKYQYSGEFHPYTCGNDECRAKNHHINGDVLVATEEGWMCMKCDYVQDWAHSFHK